MDIEPTEKGKVGELYVFGKLIERGAMPYKMLKGETRGTGKGSYQLTICTLMLEAKVSGESLLIY